MEADYFAACRRPCAVANFLNVVHQFFERVFDSDQPARRLAKVAPRRGMRLLVRRVRAFRGLCNRLHFLPVERGPFAFIHGW